MSHRAYTPEQEAEIVRRYTAGEPAMSIVRAFGGSSPAVGNVLKRNGITKRHRTGRPSWRTFTPEQAQEMGRLWHDGLSQTAIAKRFETTQWTISRVLIEHGIQPVPRYSRHGKPDARLLFRRGDQNPRWEGGRTVLKSGYVYVKIQPDHPLAAMRNSSGYVLEHRLVMAQALGRPLRADETVHHINGAKADNRPANLQLRHGKHGKDVVLVCGDCGSHNVITGPLM
jgi:hypothetical protein